MKKRNKLVIKSIIEVFALITVGLLGMAFLELRGLIAVRNTFFTIIVMLMITVAVVHFTNIKKLIKTKKI